MVSRTRKILAISSKTEDDKHILIWDFDNVDKYDMLKALSKTQSFHGLGVIYIFKSSHGFNAVCLDKFNIKEANHIKFNTRFSDYWHTKIGYKQGNWSWRIGEDKKYMRLLFPTDNWDNRIQSLAHFQFMEKQFGLKNYDGIFDSFTKIDIESYPQDILEEIE